jgi:rhodanese-related sulfurtransferase
MKISRMMFIMPLVVVLSGCWASKTDAPQFVIVNDLEKEFYDDCHIPGSIHLPFGSVKAYAEKNWDKENTEIIIHCSNYQCSASGIEAKELIEAGFKKVYAYEGGTAEWYQAGYPVEGACLQKYLTFESEPDEDESYDFPVITIDQLKKKVDENSGNVG